MRIKLNISENLQLVPFNYRELIVTKIHQWLGKNEIHDKISLYSFSSLENAITTKKGLNFPKGSSLCISAHDNGIFNLIISKIINTIEKDESVRDIGYGMKITDIQFLPIPKFNENPQRFRLGSPVFIKRTLDNKKIHYTFNNKESNELLKETLIHKMKIAGLKPDDSLKIYFDNTYSNPKEKLIEYKNIKNKCSVCPIIIEGTEQTKQFAYNVGLGNSTGIGFGFLNI